MVAYSFLVIGYELQILNFKTFTDCPLKADKIKFTYLLA